jgi:hypothetical protein
MAKKQQESGPGTGMIIALVFFVLTSAILGVTTYLGFDGQADLEKKAKDAAAEKSKLETRVAEETSRRNMLRILAGTEEATDREDLNGAATANKDAILDEYKKITDKLGATAFPPGSNFQWPLIAGLQKGDGPSGPATGPSKTLPQIARTWYDLYANSQRQYKAEQDAHKKTQDAKAAADKRAEDQKETFDKQVAALTKQITDKINAMDMAFTALKTAADEKGVAFKKQADDWAAAKAALEEQILAKGGEIEVLKGNLRRALTEDPSDILARLNKADPIKLAESMGKVNNKSGVFVTVEFNRRLSLVPGQTFVVIAPGSSLVEVLNRERELEKRHHDVVSLDAREPFSENERVKGIIEITDVVSPTTVRARVTFESQPIRNPISREDQVFNMALSSGERERVAFAGIIDLDGDGRPDTEAFNSLLQKNNLKVDAYLDLKSGEIKGRLDFGTRLLILGTDVPMVGNVKKMVEEARSKNIPMVDSRRFLNLIGVKPPRNAATPEYSRVTLGGEGALAPVDPDAPPPPVADPKKEGK